MIINIAKTFLKLTYAGLPRSNCFRFKSSTIDSSQLLQKYSGGNVIYEKDETSGISTITLNHPNRKNALSGHMMLQLSEIVTDLETWSAGRAVILCGANDSFCSGGDLALMKAIANPDEGMAMSRFMHNVIKKFCSLPLISVAVVQGQALGGGAELCVTCDFRLMSHSAVIGFVQSKLGVSPGWGGGVALTRLIGQHRALQLLITGRIMNSTECMTIGLIDDTVSDGAKGLSEAKTWLSQMLPSSSAVIHAAKRTVLNASYSHRSLEDLLRKENEILSTVWGGPAHLAALKAVKKHKK